MYLHKTRFTCQISTICGKINNLLVKSSPTIYQSECYYSKLKSDFIHLLSSENLILKIMLPATQWRQLDDQVNFIASTISGTNIGTFNIPFKGPKVWNEINKNIKKLSLSMFKNKMKQGFLESYWYSKISWNFSS